MTHKCNACALPGVLLTVAGGNAGREGWSRIHVICAASRSEDIRYHLEHIHNIGALVVACAHASLAPHWDWLEGLIDRWFQTFLGAEYGE